MAAALVLAATLTPAVALSADEELREQFDEIVEALNDNTFSEFQDAINERALINRIFGTRVIDPDVKEAGWYDSSMKVSFVVTFILSIYLSYLNKIPVFSALKSALKG